MILDCTTGYDGLAELTYNLIVTIIKGVKLLPTFQIMNIKSSDLPK